MLIEAIGQYIREAGREGLRLVYHSGGGAMLARGRDEALIWIRRELVPIVEDLLRRANP